LAAAISAARAGAAVMVADRMDRVGKKLLASGNGRCNLSNVNISGANYHGAGAAPAFSIIERLGGNFITDYFKSVGVMTAVEDESRIYPRTFMASTVLNSLRSEASRLGVSELHGHEACDIAYRGGVFETKFINSNVIKSSRVILATGGKASSVHGSNGSGYALLQRFGHRLTAPVPALTQVCLSEPGIGGLKGVRIRAGLRLISLRDGGDADGETIYAETGEILFTDYGISGIPALNLSNRLTPHLNAGPLNSKAHVYDNEKVNIINGKRARLFVSIDLFPECGNSELSEFLGTFMHYRNDMAASDLFCGILHKNIASHIVGRALGIKAGGESNIRIKANSESIDKAVGTIKDWRHEITGVKGFDYAQVTYGGLAFDDFNVKTLESKKAKGIFAAGEVLDVAGDCGGYNLHWAWVSGYVAGASACV